MNNVTTDSAAINPSEMEVENNINLLSLFQNSPLGADILANLHLYMNRQTLMRIFFFQELYQKIINIPGDIFEFGCRWGANLSLFSAFRGIYEPYNHNRKIIGFDTFSGLAGISEKDGNSIFVKDGLFSTVNNYEKYLNNILKCMENNSPIPQIEKIKLIKGDVRNTVKEYFCENSHSVVAFAYFDMDIYEPTFVALNEIKKYLVKGSIIGIDEMCWKEMPGPTFAFREALDGLNYRLLRSPLQPIPGFIEIL